MAEDLFQKKNLAPMLIGESSGPFDSADYLYELKLDGERCLAYLDGNGVDLRNKRNIKMLPKVPELGGIDQQVNAKCILDGELIITVDGKPDFSKIQRRSLMGDPFKIQLDAQKHPASFVAYDILYLDGEAVNLRPLTERKELLRQVVTSENSSLAVSRWILEKGRQLYQLAEAQALEGIVAKRLDSRYYFGKRTKEWTKIKFMQDDDFVVVGYIPKANHMTSLVLAQYNQNSGLVYQGHVTLGVGGSDLRQIKAQKTVPVPQLSVPEGNERAVWLEPALVCRVEYMHLTHKGSMRQPVYRGLRLDKRPEECSGE